MIPFWTCQNSFSNLADFNTASCALSLADFVVFSSPISTFLDKKKGSISDKIASCYEKDEAYFWCSSHFYCRYTDV